MDPVIQAKHARLEQDHARQTTATGAPANANLATTPATIAAPRVEPPQVAQVAQVGQEVPQVAQEELPRLPKSKRKKRTASIRYVKIAHLAYTYMFP